MKKLAPPAWADRFLEWYCNPLLLEEIQGDAYELFFRNVREHGIRTAKLHFIWNVFRFFRWSNIRKKKKSPSQSIPIDMLKSYIITGFRNILRNAVPSAINIVGLSMALGCAVTIFLLLDSYYDLDMMHKKGERTYLVANDVKGADETEIWANSPYLLGPAVQASQPSIETVVRIRLERGVSIRATGDAFAESVWFVDNGFFDMFSFPLISGIGDALQDKSKIVITEEMATKYFGDTDPMGRLLTLKFNGTKREEFEVAGVLEKIPFNSSMHFNFLLSSEKLEDLKLAETDSWKMFTNATFILLREGHKPEELADAFTPFKKLQNEANVTWPITRFELIPLQKVAERSYSLENSLSWSNHPAGMIALGVIAVFLVMLACFNYMNVSVAAVSTRLKEIGIRKVTGGGKKDIIIQFLMENFLLCSIALIVGTLLAYFVMVPGFNTLYSIHIPFVFSSFGMLITFFGGVLLAVALISGAYPSVYVSSFNAVSILKGKEKFGNKSRLGRILLGFQFVLAFTTIVACLVFASATYYFEHLDWGYRHAQNVVVQVQNKEQFLAMQSRVATNKNVVTYAGTESQVGHSSRGASVKNGEENLTVALFSVGFNYMETMGFRTIDGRLFNASVESDKVESAIVNESFIKKMGLKTPLQSSFELNGVRHFIVGVVSDFHADDFYTRFEPTVFVIGPEEKFQYLVLQAEGGHVQEVADFLKKSWREIAPDDPYRGFLQDEVFASMFRSNQANNRLLYAISTVALLLSCMGLYGLVSYNLTRRMKEFSVRKVFGASMINIFQLMNKDYLGIVVVSFLLGAWLGFYLMRQMLFAVYPYPVPVQVWPFLATIGLMILTVAVTILSQLSRVARENPTVTLRSE